MDKADRDFKFSDGWQGEQNEPRGTHMAMVKVYWAYITDSGLEVILWGILYKTEIEDNAVWGKALSDCVARSVFSPALWVQLMNAQGRD